jgi:hypothetical protein
MYRITRIVLVVYFTLTKACMEHIKIDSSCQHLTEREKMYFAIGLARCHFEASQKTFRGCSTMNIPECVSELSEDEWLHHPNNVGVPIRNFTSMLRIIVNSCSSSNFRMAFSPTQNAYSKLLVK